jgi:hypothetical protein
MGELTSKFSRDDIEVLLEATNDWEALGSQEWHLMNMVKGAPVPDAEQYPEAYEMVTAIKDHFKKREKDIKDSRVTRQERAVFLKAKLMLVRRDMGINQLFEMATEEPVCEDAVSEGVAAAELAGELPTHFNAAEALKKAEFFIRDLGVWDHYQKFLAEEAKKE